MGAIRRINTKGHLLNGLYSFVEDFMRNGNEEGVPADQRSPYLTRQAVFSAPWIGNAGGTLEPVTSATVTTYSPHPLENLSATTAGPGSGSFDLLVTTGGWPSTEASTIGTRLTASTSTVRQKPLLTEGMYPSGT